MTTQPNTTDPIRFTTNVGVALLLVILIDIVLVVLFGVPELISIINLISALGIIGAFQLFTEQFRHFINGDVFNSQPVLIVLISLNLVMGLILGSLYFMPQAVPTIKETQSMVEDIINNQTFIGNDESFGQGTLITRKIFSFHGMTGEFKINSETSSDGIYLYTSELPFTGNWILNHQLFGTNSRIEERNSKGNIVFTMSIDWEKSEIEVSDISVVETFSDSNTDGKYNPIDPNHDSIKMLTDTIIEQILSEENLSNIFKEDSVS